MFKVRRSRVRRTLFLLLLLGLIWVSFEARAFLREVRGYAAIAYAGPKLPDVIEQEAIVVLTGEKRRIPRAMELLRNRKSPRLIISGTGRKTNLTELMNVQSEGSGNVQEIWKRIWLESESTSTIENARESAEIFSKEKIARVILMTSDFHMVRSIKLFRHFAPQTDCIAFPVFSDVGELFFGRAESFFDPSWKLFVEFWKYFLLKYYFNHQLEPVQK
jgi:uncharacterized SAM-binding protein YcdF (DUF218 family)